MGTHREKKRCSRANLAQRFIKQKRRNLLAAPGPRDVVLVLDGLKPNFNIGKIFRSGYAFGVRQIHLIGIELFDPAPAKGAFKYVPAVFEESFASCHQRLVDEGYTIFVFNPEGGTSLQETHLPGKSAFIFGHEEFGFSFQPADYPGLQNIYIPQTGSIDSLNVSVAASIGLYEYAKQYPLKVIG